MSLALATSQPSGDALQRSHDAATPVTARLWGPDVARGFALLGIAVSNMYYYLAAGPRTVHMKPVASSGVSTWVDSASILLFDNRGFTLFSLLFGYGIAMLHRRATKRGMGPGEFYISMLKRHGLLFAIGVLHALLLFAGDIIVTYALLGLVVSALVLAPRWVQVSVFVLCVPALAFMGMLDGLSAGTDDLSWAVDVTGTLGEALIYRLATLALMILAAPILSAGILVPMIIGVWCEHAGFFSAARDRWGAMCAIAVAGVGISLLGAVPGLLVYLGALPADHFVYSGSAAILHQLTGVCGAIGYLAIAAVVAARKPAVLFPLAALGTMSMSAYLFQSVVAVAVYPAYTFGAGQWITSAHAALVSLGTWAFTVVAATVLVALGKRGPVEWLFRRLLYGKPATVSSSSTRA